MALTPYKNQQSPLNRSRSSSCSSPIRNCIVYQEIYSVGSNTLVRSYSCDQVFDKDERGQTFQTTQIRVSSFVTPEKIVRANYLNEENEIKKPRRLAVNFPSDKTEMAKNKEVPEQSKVTMSALKKAFVFTLCTALSACAFYYFLQFRECSYVWDLEKINSELEKNVFGQKQALSKINSVLNACNSSNDMHIMVFTGGVGVGKTYSSSIISHHFPWSSNKLITYSEYFAADVNKLLNEKPLVCGCKLVTVDDLNVKGTKEAISLISLLNSNRNKKENFLIILIFQLQSEEERNKVIKYFTEAYIDFDHIPFKPLTEDVVRKCFNVEIQRHGVMIPEVELEKLIKEKMSNISVVKGPSGCKGIADEVASYFKIISHNK